MELAAGAILAQQPDFEAHCVDIFACTGTLRDLLRFLDKQDLSFHG